MNVPQAIVMPGLAVILALAGCRRAAPPAPPAPAVLVAEVRQQDVPIFREWIGTLDGLVNAQINAQVRGYLKSQHYQEGELVQRGDLLFAIDPRPFQAVLDQARGQLEQARANLELTAIEVRRYTPLARDNAISQQELDDAIQANKGAQAAVSAAQAAAQQAELNLEFTRIVSPIDGIAGIAKAQVGDLVGPESGQLTAVSTVDPIKVYFPISEQEYLLAMDQRRAEGHGASAQPVRTNNLEIILADGRSHPHRGSIVLADRQVNVKTGTILLAGLVPNPGNLLRPGQYARVRFEVQRLKDALLVPQRAVMETQGAWHVVVVDDHDRAVIRPVKKGENSGQWTVITSGLQPGERVVVEGAQKVRDGVPVNPQPYQPE